MQSKTELEKWHKTKDAWGYETNKCDANRKKIILSYLTKYKKALDIGAGEGWVTTGIPAKEIHAIEIADNAAERFPSNVKRVLEPEGTYDLVMTTGTLYNQYNKQQIFNWIKKAATKHVLIAGIKDWLPRLPKPDKYIEFKYREYTQVIYFYETTPQHW
jgi:hypothetical protein